MGPVVWAWAWRFDVSAVLLAAGVVYAAGWVRLRTWGRRRLAKGRYLLLYLSGLVVIAVALMSPVDTLQNLLFSMHMLQHELLIYLGPPLLLLARPLPFSLWGLPPRIRHRLGLLFLRKTLLRRGLTVLTRPLVALGISTAVMWFWHIPTLYDLALENHIVHDLEHLSFFGAFLLYWWPLIGTAPQPAQLSTNGARALYLLAGATQAALLGGLITFADRVVYTHYLTLPRLGGVSALADQQLGGAIMWLPGPIFYGVMAVLTMKDE